MMHAFPLDELKPLSCRGRHRENRGSLDDHIGDYALTLVDSLSMLALLGNRTEFASRVDWVAANVRFDKDINVSVFELTIRMLGGLLSAHILAADPRLQLHPRYQGGLLTLATELGIRLSEAFNTPTGIPLHRIHLRRGVQRHETRTTCTACAGTLLLEFATLSRLTKRPKFEAAARHAMMQLSTRLSPLGLAGGLINVDTGVWENPSASIGAGSDSFYEYAAKAAIMLGDPEMDAAADFMIDSVISHLATPSGFYFDAHILTGAHTRNTVDALGAFWPALLVLRGDVDRAKQSYAAFLTSWEKHGLLPEVWQPQKDGTQVVIDRASPLRPELIESTYFLYTATQDPYYLHTGRKMLKSLQAHARVECGFATVADVTSRRLEDRMDSFMLSETAKYLFLLFDSALPSTEQMSVINSHDMVRYVFTTEAHLLPVLSPLPDNAELLLSKKICPASASLSHEVFAALPAKPAVVTGRVASTPEEEALARLPPPQSHGLPDPHEIFVRLGETIVPLAQLHRHGVFINIDHPGALQNPASRKSSPTLAMAKSNDNQSLVRLVPLETARITLDAHDAVDSHRNPHSARTLSIHASALAEFGPAIKDLRRVSGWLGMPLDQSGCSSSNEDSLKGAVALVERGQCDFLSKVLAMEDAGAVAVVVFNLPQASNLHLMTALTSDPPVHIPVFFIMREEGLQLIQDFLGASARIDSETVHVPYLVPDPDVGATDIAGEDEDQERRSPP
eukprot:TRINITY_DN5748_c0_g1_i1.p1 TRINITY_DN5748_c0_g1~~TRINITY_DN5748_c0_g1_i1.p1  ORF type:complete len:796 (-),score=157.68 TRINITY_DN5748_c0_g1_i1:14-2224(-)